MRRYNVIERRLAEVQEDPAAISVYINPDDNERRHLVENLKLDEHTLLSTLDPDELSRLEFEPEHVAFIFKRPRSYSQEDHLTFRVSSAGAFLFKDRLVVVLPEDVPVFDSSQLLKMQTPVSLLLRLILRLIVHFREHLKIISLIADELQDRLQTAMENRYLLNMFTLEKSLVYYLNAIQSNSAVLEKIKLSAAKIGFTAEEIELLDDTAIENNQCYRQAEIYSNIVASLMDARASIVSNNLNVLMKTLNLITIGIMVPTLVVSAFSMNVAIPMQEHPYAFWIIMGFATLSVGVVTLVWRRKRW
ncbi:MAG: magnesium transporter CorA family protein [Deltaproteobacteria bacterium]|nr:magnesium transporter CorA family protein [Deltaproteobacteria bacterium]